jgi:hypothetical protein
MTDDECRQIYTDAMELPNRNAVSVMRHIVAAHTAKLLAGVEMPERYDCVRDIERNVTEDVFTSDQLQAYAAAAALNARNKALEEGFDAGFVASARDWSERDDLLADMDSPAYIRDRADAIEALKGKV